LWLGDSLRPYVPYFMAAMTIYFVEIAWGVPYYCLVAYGRAHALALLSTVTAVATSLALFAAGLLELPLAAYIGCVAVYVVMYALFVRHHFRVRLQLATRTLDLQILLAAACGVVGASFVLRADRAVEVVVVATAAVATFAILSHFMASPLHRMARLLRGSARQ
jgi:ABC-type xylose transport system permease subunit